jgi:hypothetical protein
MSSKDVCPGWLATLVEAEASLGDRIEAARRIAAAECTSQEVMEALNEVAADLSQPAPLLVAAAEALGRLTYIRGDDPNFGGRDLGETAYDPYIDEYFRAKEEASGRVPDQ